MTIFYDPVVLQVVKMDQSFSGGVFAWVVKDGTPGAVSFRGAFGQQGSPTFALATLAVKVLAVGSTQLRGSVITLSQANVQSSPIGTTPTPRDFIAGHVWFTAHSPPQRRRDAVLVTQPVANILPANLASTTTFVADIQKQHYRALQAYQTRRAQAPRCTVASAMFSLGVCSNPQPCIAQETGDCNGDGVFDANDVGLFLIFLLEDASRMTSPRAQQLLQLFTQDSHEKQALDVDLNGKVNALDMSFLNLVNLNILRFVKNVIAEPRSMHTDTCRLVVSLQLLSKRDVPASASDTHVSIDFAHTNQSFQQQFESSVFHVGSVALPAKGSAGLYGGIVQASLTNSST